MSFEGLDDDISVSSIDSEIMASNVCISQHILACLGVWLWLFFKVFFISKYIKIIFFLFFKNYF